MTTLHEASQELADALAPSPSAIAQMAAQYSQMKAARRVLPDGEIMSEKDYTDALDVLNKILKKYVEQSGSFHVEGVGTVRLQDRATAWNWDAKACAENDMKTFARLLEMGGVTFNTKVVEALEASGQITAVKQYGHRGGTSALIIDKADA